MSVLRFVQFAEWIEQIFGRLQRTGQVKQLNPSTLCQWTMLWLAVVIVSDSRPEPDWKI
jgi:hypothetical protein